MAKPNGPPLGALMSKPHILYRTRCFVELFTTIARFFVEHGGLPSIAGRPLVIAELVLVVSSPSVDYHKHRGMVKGEYSAIFFQPAGGIGKIGRR